MDEIVTPTSAARTDPVSTTGIDCAAILCLEDNVVDVIPFDFAIVAAHLHTHAGGVVNVIVAGDEIHAVERHPAGIFIEDAHVVDVAIFHDVRRTC